MKKNPVIFALFIFLFAGIMLQSCKKDNDLVSMDVDYSRDISSLMNNYCLTCHSGAAPEAGLNLDNYSAVRAISENGKLVERTNDVDNPMPPSGLISEANRQKIKDWIAGGYPQ